MAESMRLSRLHPPAKILGLINPHQGSAPSGQLAQYAYFIRSIRAGALGQAQLPPLIPNSTIHKPINWWGCSQAAFAAAVKPPEREQRERFKC